MTESIKPHNIPFSIITHSIKRKNKFPMISVGHLYIKLLENPTFLEKLRLRVIIKNLY